MRLFIFCFMILAGIDPSWALYQQSENDRNDGTRELRVLHTEEQSFFVDTYIVGADGWQERVGQRKFSSSQEALRFFSRTTKHFQNSLRLKTTAVTQVRSLTPVWTVTQQWDLQWEKQYTEWVNKTIDVDFFMRHQIATDCADVAYVVRWIFARINGLPAAVTLAGGSLFTQEKGKADWAKLPTDPEWHKDQRFLTALDYIMRNTFTHTLVKDSYPVDVSPQGVLPGGYHLALREESGHTRLVHGTNPGVGSSKVITFVASDVPKKIRRLSAEPFGIRKFIPEGSGGFMRFRWPILDNGQYVLAASETMPSYSLNQFSGDFANNYYRTVLARMGMKNKPAEQLRVLLDLAWQKFSYRVNVVQEGFKVCQTEDCSPGTMNYENWSTPSRDSQIRDVVVEIYELLNDNWGSSAVDGEFEKWRYKSLEIESGTTVTLEELLDIWNSQSFSSDPRSSVLDRWGVEDSFFFF